MENINEDLIGEIKPALKKAIKVGDIVLFCENDPFEDKVNKIPAIVTIVHDNGSVSLTVFNETHLSFRTKILLAEKPLAGYYIFND